MIARCLRRGVFAALASLTAYGQAPPAPPQFEVASIKPAPTGASQVRAGLRIDGSQVSGAALSLKNLLGIAYRVKDYQVSGPDWLPSERFDLNAKLPSESAARQVPEMLQALLQDRFQLKMHRENKDLPAYALVTGKGPLTMQETAPDSLPDTPTSGGSVNVAASGQPGVVSINYGNGAEFTFANNQLEGHKLSARLMADVLSRFTDRPVVDMTDLKGNYNFVLEFTPEDFLAMRVRVAIAAGVPVSARAQHLADTASNDSLFAAVEKLGLKLESRKAPFEMLVIDRAEKTPTEN